MSKCRSCGRSEGRHWVSCAANRCQRCRRAPATIGGWCGPCWRAIQRERKVAVDAAIQRLDGENES
jgi:hypothetical protein